MKSLQPGIEETVEIVPRPDDTAAAVGNAGIDVIATTTLILYIETACDQLVAPYYESGEATVGTRVEVDHLAPASIGTPVQVSAKLEQVRGRRLIFVNDIRQGTTSVMSGYHHRNVVPMGDFSDSVTHADREPPVIDFWFDFHSPWCYLASTRIGALAREHRVTLRWRPVHLANLMDKIDGRRPLEGNDAFDITDPETLAELAGRCALDAKRVRSATTDESYKQVLQANLTEAVANEIFGLPTVIIQTTQRLI